MGGSVTREEIIRMVKEIAGSDLDNATVAEKVLDEIVPLCAAVAAWNGWQAGAAAERERCLDWCAAYTTDDGTAQKIASAIRGMK